jgi:Spy/CpxP family protein refolding chaperone
MKRALGILVLLFVPVIAMSQLDRSPAEKVQAPAVDNPLGLMQKGLSMPGGLFDKFWDEPATAAELKLSNEQKRQLREMATKQQLALIDRGSDVLKALVMLSSIANAEELDEAAYSKQLDNLATASGKIIHEVGDMALAPRRILTPVQYQTLKSLQRARREAAQQALQQNLRESGRPTPKHPAIPPSLTTPYH